MVAEAIVTGNWGRNVKKPVTPTKPVTPVKTQAPVTPAPNTVPKSTLTSQQLVDKALTENATKNLQTQSWWNSQDQATRDSAYKQIQSITSSAQGMAGYVKSKGLTDLQKYDWWNTSQYKNDAWKMVQGNQTPAPAATPQTYPQTNIPLSKTEKVGNDTYTASGFNITQKTETPAAPAANKMSPGQLAKEALLKNSTANLQDQAWWSGQDQATKTAAYQQLQEITGSAESMARYVLANGLTDLQKYSWWANSPYKQAAWELIQKNSASLDWKTAQNTDELNNWLNKKQQEGMTGDEVPTRDNPSTTSDVQSFSDALSAIQPKDENGNVIDAPTFNSEAKLNQLRTEAGVDPLETELNDLKAQAEEIQASLRAQKINEQGKAVPMSVIAGRMSEEERQAQERLDYITRRQAAVTDQLNTKYSAINATMTAFGNDYEAASKAYERSYNQNLAAIDLYRTAQADQKSEQEVATDNARANLQVLYNNVVDGSMDPDNMSQSQLQMIQKLEVQSGLPSGTFQQLRSKDPEYSIKVTKDGTDKYGNKGVYLIKENPRTGETKIDFVMTGGASGGMFGGTSTSGGTSGGYQTKGIQGVQVSVKNGELQLSAPDKSWQCGELVNRAWGLSSGGSGGFGSTESEKKSIVDKRGVRSANVKDYSSIMPGMAFVKEITSGAYDANDHVGLVRTAPDAQGNFTTWEANARGDGKVTSRTLNIKDVYGFAPPPEGKYEEIAGKAAEPVSFSTERTQLARLLQENPIQFLQSAEDELGLSVTRVKELLGGEANYQRIINMEDPNVVFNKVETNQYAPNWLIGGVKGAVEGNPLYDKITGSLAAMKRGDETIGDKYYAITGKMLQEGSDDYINLQRMNGDWTKMTAYIEGLKKETKTSKSASKSTSTSTSAQTTGSTRASF
jgi:hypothetical protein